MIMRHYEDERSKLKKIYAYENNDDNNVNKNQ